MFAKIAVLDFGSYSQTLVKRIRALEVYAELYDYNVSLDVLKADEIKGIILSGSALSVYDENAYLVDPAIFKLDKPVLGVCYGMQLMAQLLAGEVKKMVAEELKETNVMITQMTPLTKGVNQPFLVWMEHQDYLTKLPTDFINSGETDQTPHAMMYHSSLPLYGVQFHPEILANQANQQILRNFLFDICQLKPDWTMANFVKYQVAEIRQQVQNDHIICGLSGGVDSSVVAMLLNQAVPDQLNCILIDHGLMRKNEAQAVIKIFSEQFNLRLKAVNAQDIFLSALKGVTDPETKRKIIGNKFVEVFSAEANLIPAAKWLAQGTIYSDVIESGLTSKKFVKSHHNVGGLPKDLKFKLLEPLKMLFKDEVRTLGSYLGLSDELINRQPFPGPGLGVRIIGEITAEKIRLVQESDAIMHEVLKEAGLANHIWQFFPVLTDTTSVGVTAGERTYGHLLALRAVNSSDAMSATIAEIPYPVLNKIMERIISEVPGINRVVYDITSKPPGTIEWE